MRELDARVDALCTVPAGCGFLLTIADSGLSPAVAARPGVSVYAAAIAQSAINPFQPDHDRVVATVLAEGPRLRR